MKLSLKKVCARFLAIVRSQISLTVIISIISVTSAATAGWSAERGRVNVQNGTVLSDRNTPLRGARMQLVANGYVAPNSYWQYLNATLGLNAVRYGVRTVTVGRTVEQQLPALDVAVNRAAANNLYLMINTATRSGTYNLQELKKFWSVIAPRYKNRTHVFYEMTNEPVQGGPYWGAPEQYTDQVLADLKSVYLIMRGKAPDTHIALFTTANIWPTCASWAGLIAKMKGIDWTKTSIGFHHYNGTHQIGEAGVQCLREKYPLLMTETNYWTEPFRAVLRNALSMYEKLGMSWFSIDGNGSAFHLEEEILPALHSAGYAWPAER